MYFFCAIYYLPQGCLFLKEGHIFWHAAFFSLYSPLVLYVYNRLLTNCLGHMAVDTIKKHLLGSLNDYTHLGPHFCPQPTASGRVRAAVSIFDFVCPYRSSLSNYYIPVHGNTALLSSHRGCSKDKNRPTLVLRPSTKLWLLLFKQF